MLQGWAGGLVDHPMYASADPGGGRWGARPPLGRSFIIQNALFNNIQTLESITGRPPLGELLYPPVPCTYLHKYRRTATARRATPPRPGPTQPESHIIVNNGTPPEIAIDN